MSPAALKVIDKVAGCSQKELNRYETLSTLPPLATEVFDLLARLTEPTLAKMIDVAKGRNAIPTPLDGGTLTTSGEKAARRLGVSKTTIWRMVKDGTLKTIEIRGKNRILSDSLIEFVRKGTKVA